MIEQTFGASSRWSVGVEEELMLVDEQTFELVPAAPLLLEEGGGFLKHELLGSIVETTTAVCETPAEALEQMIERRRDAARRAERHGLRVLAAGSHPFSRPEDQPVTDKPDYVGFVELAGPAARRQGVSGLHVHVGMPDAETCVRALECALPWLPVVLALSANSPFFRGEETGLLSTRAEVLASLPRAGAPPHFATYGAWEAAMERWLAAGLVKRYTNAWWDARVHPQFGTLELRIADQPTDVRVAGAIVAALHRIAVRAAKGDLPTAPREDYETNRFAAARFGPRAMLIWVDRLVGVDELALELDSGLDVSSCEADRQLERRGDLRALAAELAERTVGS
jgi:glutamate---cysteine ligase / carboxylate-amine ligase